MRDRNRVLAMASGVATTAPKKLHFTNWLNQNCESSVWVGGLSPASREAKQTWREFARFTAGICEFHHEQHVHDTCFLCSLLVACTHWTTQPWNLASSQSGKKTIWKTNKQKSKENLFNSGTLNLGFLLKVQACWPPTWWQRRGKKPRESMTDAWKQCKRNVQSNMCVVLPGSHMSSWLFESKQTIMHARKNIWNQPGTQRERERDKQKQKHRMATKQLEREAKEE